jgi:hypothetical protein
MVSSAAVEFSLATHEIRLYYYGQKVTHFSAGGTTLFGGNNNEGDRG